MGCPLLVEADPEVWPLGRGLDLPVVVLPLAELLLLLSTEDDEAWLEEGGGGEL